MKLTFQDGGLVVPTPPGNILRLDVDDDSDGGIIVSLNGDVMGGIGPDYR